MILNRNWVWGFISWTVFFIVITVASQSESRGLLLEKSANLSNQGILQANALTNLR